MPKFIKIFLFFVVLLVCTIFIKRAIPRSDVNWEYKTYRPLFAGWSTVREPVVDADRIYFCGGYGWWSNQAIVVALDFQGHEIWRFDIQKPCDSISKKGDKIVAWTFESKTTADKRIEKIYHRFTIDPATGAAKEETLPQDHICTTENSVYFLKPDRLQRMDMQQNETGSWAVSKDAQGRFLSCMGQDFYFAQGLSVYRWPDSDEKPVAILNAVEGIHSLRFNEGRICFIDSAQRAENGMLKCFGKDQKSLFELRLLGSDQYYIGKNSLYTYDSTRHLRMTDFQNGTTKPLRNSPFNVNVLGENLPVIYTGGAHEFYAYDLQAEKVLWETKFSGWVHHAMVLSDQLLITDDDGILTSMPFGGPIHK